MEEHNHLHESPFSEVIEKLLDLEIPFPPRYLYRLSDLSGTEVDEFKTAWAMLPDWRRQGLLEDLDAMFERDTLLSFEAICRLALSDSQPLIRFTALRSLQDYEVKDLIPEILRFLEEDANEEMRALSASHLGKYVYLGEIEKISPITLTAIEDSLLRTIQGGETSLVRRKALESLGYSSRPEVKDLVEIAFNTQEEDWVSSALFAMGRTYDKTWEPQILAMMDHKAPKIRVEAIRAAGELGIVKSRPHLLAALETDEPEIRLAAVWSLSQIGGEMLQQVFETLLDETDDNTEAEFIEEALDNLIFNQSIGFFDDFNFEEQLNL